MMTASDARARALEILSFPADIPVLLAHFLGVSRSFLLAHPETPLGGAESAFFDAVRLRSAGLPVAYITGVKEFWGLPFRVTPVVLIPKPDTEILVERAIEIIKSLDRPDATCSPRNPGPETIEALDVCTGSGCVAISILHDCPGISVTATDISEEALAIARTNGRNLLCGSRDLRFIQGDLREGLPPAENRVGYSLVVSNPPYVPSAVVKELLADGRGEPALALDGGADGLDLVRALARQSLAVLAPRGTLLVETGEYNARSAADCLIELGFLDIVIHKDLEGQDRVVEGKLA